MGSIRLGPPEQYLRRLTRVKTTVAVALIAILAVLVAGAFAVNAVTASGTIASTNASATGSVTGAGNSTAGHACDRTNTTAAVSGPRPEVEPKAHGLPPPGQDAPFPVPLFPGSSARYNYRSGLDRDGRGGQPRTSPVVAVSEQHRGGHQGPGPARDPRGAAERAAARGGLGPGLQDGPAPSSRPREERPHHHRGRAVRTGVLPLSLHGGPWDRLREHREGHENQR